MSCIKALLQDQETEPAYLIHRNKNRDSGKLSQQRTMFQIKERDKTPEELSKVENFPDGQRIGICLPTHGTQV